MFRFSIWSGDHKNFNRCRSRIFIYHSDRELQKWNLWNKHTFHLLAYVVCIYFYKFNLIISNGESSQVSNVPTPWTLHIFTLYFRTFTFFTSVCIHRFYRIKFWFHYISIISYYILFGLTFRGVVRLFEPSFARQRAWKKKKRKKEKKKKEKKAPWALRVAQPEYASKLH